MRPAYNAGRTSLRTGVNLHVKTIDGKEQDAVEMFQKLNMPKLKVKWSGKA